MCNKKISLKCIMKTNSELQNILDCSLDDITYFDIAKVTHSIYKNMFVVTNIKNQIWFCFKDHKWIKTELGPYKEISTNIIDIYRNYMNILQIKDKRSRRSSLDERRSSLDERRPSLDERRTSFDEKYSIERKIENCEKILFLLKDVKSKEIIYKECLYLFYNESFMTYLDNNYDLIPFQNGVYDLKNDSFRDGTYDDYLSIYINSKYENENKDSDIIKEFITFRNDLCTKRFRNFNKMFILKNDW